MSLKCGKQFCIPLIHYIPEKTQKNEVLAMNIVDKKTQLREPKECFLSEDHVDFAMFNVPTMHLGQNFANIMKCVLRKHV